MKLKIAVITICLIITLASLIKAINEPDRMVFESYNLNLHQNKFFVDYDPTFYSTLNDTKKTRLSIIIRNYEENEVTYLFNITPIDQEDNLTDYCLEENIYCSKENALTVELPRQETIASKEKEVVTILISLKDTAKEGQYDLKIQSYESNADKIYAEKKLQISIGEEYFRYGSIEEAERGVRSLQMSSMLFISVALISLVFLFMLLMVLNRD
jgi:hypothetical protein